jgi:hypothetical protein
VTKRLLAVAAALAVALGGCGGGDKKASTPLGEALSYLPKDAPAVAVIESDPDSGQWKQVSALIEKFTIASQIRQQGKDRLARGPLDFDRDLRPQLGNEVVVGVPKAGVGRQGYVLTVKLKDPDGARNGLGANLKKAGLESRIDGDVLVDGLTEKDFESDMGRLNAGQPLLRATGDLENGLGAGSAGGARRSVAWIGALRRFALAGKARPDGLALDYDVRTQSVADADLPLAPGPQSPPVPQREGEIAVAVREPGRTLGFMQRLAELAPKGTGRGSKIEGILKASGVDVQRDLIAKIGDTGAASLPLDGSYVARADLKDPKGFSASLAKLAAGLSRASDDLGFRVEPGGGAGFYRVSGTDGKQLFVGVTGDQVAIGEEAGRARDFAKEKSAPVPGARGSVAFAADAQSVANAIIERRATGAFALLGQLVTQPLGDLRGWAETTRTGITGHAELKIE